MRFMLLAVLLVIGGCSTHPQQVDASAFRDAAVDTTTKRERHVHVRDRGRLRGGRYVPTRWRVATDAVWRGLLRKRAPMPHLT